MKLGRVKSGNNNPSRNSGFTLGEVMISVALVGILASIAYPSYTYYAQKARRSQATTALLEMSTRQLTFYNDNNFAYTSVMADLPFDAIAAGGNYTLDIPVVTTTGYTLRARVVVGSLQEDDGDCVNFTLTSTGQQDAKNYLNQSNDDCW